MSTPARSCRRRRSRAPRCAWRRPGRRCRRGARRSSRPSRGPPPLPCRCRPAALRRGSAAPPGAACSSPSARGWRRRSRGTGSAPRRPTRAASARRRSKSIVLGRHQDGSRRPCGTDTSSAVNLPSRVDLGIGLGDRCSGPPPSPRGRRTSSLTLPSFDHAVRALDEAVLVDRGVGRERVDQADVRAFRRLDRADAAVMRRMHVAHLEAGALARQTARPQRREAALVRHFRQRVGLVHELRQLRWSRRTRAPPPPPAWR